MSRQAIATRAPVVQRMTISSGGGRIRSIAKKFEDDPREERVPFERANSVPLRSTIVATLSEALGGGHSGRLYHELPECVALQQMVVEHGHILDIDWDFSDVCYTGRIYRDGVIWLVSRSATITGCLAALEFAAATEARLRNEQPLV